MTEKWKLERTMMAVPVMSSARPIRFREDLCIGCNRCVEACQVDVLLPNPEKGKPPVVAYPGECYYCGCCGMECRCPGALILEHPLMNQAKFIPRKEAGDNERAGA